MKKILLTLITLFINYPLYANQITHIDYTSGNTITAAGQNTNENAIISTINGNLDNANIKSNVLTGSTANSGGSAGNINQGTISTPDFRLNAVSTSVVNAIDSASSMGTMSGSGRSVTITTIGGNVLISASETLGSSGAGGPFLNCIEVKRGNTIVSASQGCCYYTGNISVGCTDNTTVLDTGLPAGTTTYTLYHSNTVSQTILGSNLTAIELRD